MLNYDHAGNTSAAPAPEPALDHNREPISADGLPATKTLYPDQKMVIYRLDNPPSGIDPQVVVETQDAPHFPEARYRAILRVGDKPGAPATFDEPGDVEDYALSLLVAVHERASALPYRPGAPLQVHQDLLLELMDHSANHPENR